MPPAAKKPSTDRLIAATKKLREHLNAPGAREPRPPVLNFTEEHGGGNAVLDKLVVELRGKAPRALVDCDNWPAEGLPELLTQIKTRLSRRCASYPTVRFRRLELGLAVIAEEISFTSHREARRKLRRAAVKTFARVASDEPGAGGVSGFVKMLPAAVGWIGAAVVALVQTRIPSLYDFYKWYGHRDRNLPDLPINVIEELNETAYPGQSASPATKEAAYRRRDEILVDALLADLRSAYGKGRLTRSQWYSPVVLLRNADIKVGPAFLERLREIQHELNAAPVRTEPLLVVAGSERHIAGTLEDRPTEGSES